MRMTRQRSAAGTERHRERIINAASDLLKQQGRDAVSTRTVSAAAGVQAPVIYRLFGDKEGLLDAIAVHGYAAHLAQKKALAPTGDPVDDLRAGWEQNISFALDNPSLYALIWGEPRPGAPMAAAEGSYESLRESIHRIAEAGLLRVPEELATQMVHAAGRGTALTLLSLPPDQRDSALSDANRDAVITAIVSRERPAGADDGTVDPATTAIALRAVLPRATALTERERAILEEWLDRIAGQRRACEL
jgi:AcrR family transcriptional regulator